MGTSLPGFPGEALHLVTKADTRKAAVVLAESFSEDPYMHYILQSDAYDYAQALQLQLFTMSVGLKYGLIVSTSVDMEGIMICYPPEHIHINDFQYVTAGALGLMLRVERNVFTASTQLGAFMKDVQKRVAPFPHWYIYQIGVHREHRGHSMASRLLNPFLEKMDECQSPCYLETHNERNVPVYEHFGFKVAETGTIPSIGKPYWGMLKFPRPASD